MIQRISNINAPVEFDASQLAPFLASTLNISSSDIIFTRIVKKSVDARKKTDLHFVLTIDFELASGVRITLPRGANLSEPRPEQYSYPMATPCKRAPLVVGFGPAGFMAALVLAEAGMCPTVVERGTGVDQRRADAAHFFASGELNPRSNVQFGEGGAGTFSDGKLTTGIKDPRCQEVLRVFQRHGAPESILYEAKPHIGTDNLPGMVKSIRERIIALGGKVLFETALEALETENGRIIGATLRKHGGSAHSIEVDDIILAIGHSARDTLTMLERAGILMQKKPFSIGVRIEHPQELINRSQYGALAGHKNLGAADYKLSERLRSGRGMYTFCMCPGGQVVAAASESGRLVVNGMSNYTRDGLNANAALLVSVEPDDFPGESQLSGLIFQEKWEQHAFNLGGGNFRAPAQLVADFLARRPSSSMGDVIPSYKPGVTWTSLDECLPNFVTSALREALPIFDARINGFAAGGAVLTGVETRSSSPVTILRDNQTRMASIAGLYPCGEGAGYAGGIMSAAVDGMRCAESLINTNDSR